MSAGTRKIMCIHRKFTFALSYLIEFRKTSHVAATSILLVRL